ncbi:MAG: circularly permuted type 2 ATP-grasp protein [Phycisphaerales bacterium]|nr:circularly permuted type 2 ATP-grasp protein [Phycisphaerales bacterium]
MSSSWSIAEKGWDEGFEAKGTPREAYAGVVSVLDGLDESEIQRREQLQQISLINQGITFTVYGEREGTERVFPFDFVPRIITADEWSHLEAGLQQRVQAINLFLVDVYGEQRSLREGIVPWELVFSRPDFRRELVGVLPRLGVFTHVAGIDLLRGEDGGWLVLEDNCRCPSGVSYVVENRGLLTRVFPDLFREHAVRPVDHYPQMLLETLRHVAPRGRERPVVAVLSPGAGNSAAFEHSFLAREMGVPLVEGRDLIVEDDQVSMRTTGGRERIDVLYRRIDDAFLDPVVFRPDSMLGVPGLVHAARAGNITLANAPGAGVADDKAVYPFMPDLIRFFLDEAPLLEQVPTFSGRREDDARFIADNLADLVVKRCDGAGGYGMLVGPTSSTKEIEDFRGVFEANPGDFVAQHLVEFSSHPTWTGDGFAPRHVDLRPFVLCGESIRVLPGGLTRVALQEGSYVVNSSQGGGSKDTWVLASGGAP